MVSLPSSLVGLLDRQGQGQTGGWVAQTRDSEMEDDTTMIPDIIYFEQQDDDLEFILDSNLKGWYLVERVETLAGVIYGMVMAGPFSTN